MLPVLPMLPIECCPARALPPQGMMTGQILAGADPSEAARYQMVRPDAVVPALPHTPSHTPSAGLLLLCP